MIWNDDERDEARYFLLSILPDEIARQLKGEETSEDPFSGLFPASEPLEQLVQERRILGAGPGIEGIFFPEIKEGRPASPARVLSVFDPEGGTTRRGWFLELLEEAAERVFLPEDIRRAADQASFDDLLLPNEDSEEEEKLAFEALMDVGAPEDDPFEEIPF